MIKRKLPLCLTYCAERQFPPEEAIIKVENEQAQISAAVLVTLQGYSKLLIKVKQIQIFVAKLEDGGYTKREWHQISNLKPALA